ncbi:MAG: class I SAM-dependent methyltransferase, partial [Steroidobacteraceae bacterium]
MSAALPEGTTAEQVKSCCADFYASDWAGLLLGESFHPGGTRLTDRLADLLQLGRDSRVLDVAAGRGGSAIHLAQRRGCRVIGVDLSAANVDAATANARADAVDDLVTFVVGDAESLGIDNGDFDAVICECALCTFPDKAQAARGFARVLRPGGRVGISEL